ncbi:TetR/AcrR family transcriptional regulator [Nocardia sp. IFM 10818]
MSPRKAAALRDSAGDQGLRDHLLATAQRLIAEQGAAGLTVRAIARAARVADGVLYNHFADKDELLAAAVTAHVVDAHAQLGDLPSPGTGALADNLRAYLRAGLTLHRTVLPVYAGLLTSPSILARLAEAEEPHQDWRSLLADYLSAEKELGRLASHADPHTAAALLAGICHDEVLTTLLSHATPARADPDAVIAALLTGIAPEPE